MSKSAKQNKSSETQEILIQKVEITRAKIAVIGESPLIMNRMAEKARQELLLPARRKTSADKRANLKHDPIKEFRSSMYVSSKPDALTALHLPSGSFSKSMAQAALDIPGASKAQILRLVRVKADSVSVYGIPKLHMSVVRTLGQNRTPDIRSRACFSEWAAVFDVEFVTKLITENTITLLLGAAGFLSGVGDWRGEKGGSNGQYRASSFDDPAFLEMVKTGGRKQQLKAIENPECYDPETLELFTWFEGELAAR